MTLCIAKFPSAGTEMMSELGFEKRTKVGLGLCHAVFTRTLLCKDGKFALLNLC